MTTYTFQTVKSGKIQKRHAKAQGLDPNTRFGCDKIKVVLTRVPSNCKDDDFGKLFENLNKIENELKNDFDIEDIKTALYGCTTQKGLMDSLSEETPKSWLEPHESGHGQVSSKGDFYITGIIQSYDVIEKGLEMKPVKKQKNPKYNPMIQQIKDRIVRELDLKWFKIRTFKVGNFEDLVIED